MRTLFETSIGSHAWGMQHPGSDVDIFRCVQVPTKEILKHGLAKGRFMSVGNTDTQESEVGTVVQQLIKNNLNYIVAVMSPITVYDSDQIPALGQLRAFVPRCLSKQLYHSFHGMSVGNFKKYHMESGDGTIPEYRLNKIARVLLLGIHLLDGRPVAFEPFKGATVETIKRLTADLDNSFKMSGLPEKCPIEEEMLDWLVELRLAYLE